MSNDFWYVYIIKTSDGLFYTGITTDLIRRWAEHLSMAKGGKKGAKFFRGREPKSLEFLQKHTNRSSATKLESKIKSLSRNKKIDFIQSSINLLEKPILSFELVCEVVL